LSRVIYHDYSYTTIRSIFFNHFLGCSNRILEKGEAKLQRDVRTALKSVQELKAVGTPGYQQILRIKKQLTKDPDEKRTAIMDFIANDLMFGAEAVGTGMKCPELASYYFFSKTDKMLMDLESVDFQCYVMTRYGVSEREFEIIKGEMMRRIWERGQKVEPYRFAYFDNKRLILYISNHDNGIYRLDGEKIELCGNGIDGVFFEFDVMATPFIYKPDMAVINYFQGNSDITESQRLGFDLERFNADDCYLNKYLISLASFAKEEGSIITSEDQKLLLIIYFYSLFFESILYDKPIVCFMGAQASGKSTIAACIGKILFGDSFKVSNCPTEAERLRVMLCSNYYLALDNVDQYVPREMANDLCTAATDKGIIQKRKLHTTNEIARYTPHIFILITSREGKFKHSDLVSRLLLFSTEQIRGATSKKELFDSVLSHRDGIMTEVLTNLNSLINILKHSPSEKSKTISRLADWESFGRRLCCKGLEMHHFISIMENMDKKKDAFAIEDDYLFQIPYHIIYDEGEPLEQKAATPLYKILLTKAEEMKATRDFTEHYKNPAAMGRRLVNIKKQLNDKFEFKIEFEKHTKKNLYTFRAKLDVKEV